jgi:hypothetical protein
LTHINGYPNVIVIVGLDERTDVACSVGALQQRR